jgi:predicted sugar kinase
MNERIQSLITQAGTDTSGKWMSTDHAEKFAGLIVRECVKEMSQQMYWHGMDQSNNPTFYKVMDKTMEHFGVKE